MNRKNQFFKIGILIGIVIQMAQGILVEKRSIPLLLFLYIAIITIPIIFKKGRMSLGIILGYLLGYLIFILLVYLAYNILFYLTKLYNQ